MGWILALAVAAGACAQAQAAPLPEGLSEAHARYTKAFAAYLECLRNEGVEATAEPSANGVLYAVGFASPGYADGAEFWRHEAERVAAMDKCETEELLSASALVETLIRPADSELREIAGLCANSYGIEGTDGAATGVNTADIDAVAAASPDAANCIVVRIADLTRTRFGSEEFQGLVLGS